MRTKAERNDFRLQVCVHWNGTMEQCGAGVNFQDVCTTKEKWTTCTIPCVGKCAEAKCDKLQLPTQADLDEEDRSFAELFARSMTARAAIVAHNGGKRGVVGEIDCPICKTGKLRYSVAKCNGHIHAGCTTENCVCWME